MHAGLMIKALLRNYINQEKCPAELYKTTTDSVSAIANATASLACKYRETKQISEKYVLLAHLSQRLIGELIVYPWSGVRRTSSVVGVVHNAQTSSSQKPLGRSKPNFMWSLLG